MITFIAILQSVIVVAAILIVRYVQGIPEQVHKKNIESFKNELQKEIVKLEASEGNLHLKKIEKFTQFSKVLHDAMSGVKYKEMTDSELQEEAMKSMENFTKDIMFFAGENTIKKFVEYRRYSQLYTKEKEKGEGKAEQVKFLYIQAELILEMRRDLGYEDDISVDDYLHILINDWEDHKDIYKEQASKAKQL